MGRSGLAIALIAVLLLGATRLLPARAPRGHASLRAAESACRLYMARYAAPQTLR